MHVRLQEGHPNHFRVLKRLTMVRRLRSSECSELTQSTQSLLEESPRDSKFLICRWCPSDIHPSAEARNGSSGSSNYSSCSIDTLEVVWQHRWWKSSPEKYDHEKWQTFIVPRLYREFDPQMSGVPDLRGVQPVSLQPVWSDGFRWPCCENLQQGVAQKELRSSWVGIFMAGFGVTQSQSRSCNGSEWTDTHRIIHNS